MIPYVIGQWVRGSRFYGRERVIGEILAGPDSRSWWAGLRRIGKTSLLRELELRLLGDPGRAALPVVWDLQGVATGSDLAESFAGALLDAEEALSRFGLSPELASPAGAEAAVANFCRRALELGAEPWLLVDEADAWLDLAAADPGLPARLWAALDGARGVVVSSVRLADQGLDARGPRAVPGLAECFGPPRWLGVLTPEDAASLVAQDRLSAADRPRLAATELTELCRWTGCHPLLLQILAKRRLELGSLEAALRHVAADRSVAHLFAVDFDLLAPAERSFLTSGGEPRKADRLVALGLVRYEDGNPRVAVPLLAQWLARERV